MAIRSKGERKPVCHDTVLVDVGECYSCVTVMVMGMIEWGWLLFYCNTGFVYPMNSSTTTTS